jgi:hypothetical protein
MASAVKAVWGRRSHFHAGMVNIRLTSADIRCCTPKMTPLRNEKRKPAKRSKTMLAPARD